MTQRTNRINTFSVLFGMDTEGSETMNDINTTVSNYFESLEGADADELEERGFNSDPFIEEDKRAPFAARIQSIVDSLPEIDKAIDEVAEGWSFSRMTQVDRTILRLGAYEMLKDDSVPVKVAINEAVELAKIYGNPKSPSFVNGILAKLVK